MARERNGFAFFCADPAGHERLVRDCKAERLGGVAVDLHSLVFGEDRQPRSLMEISKGDGLWIKEW